MSKRLEWQLQSHDIAGDSFQQQCKSNELAFHMQSNKAVDTSTRTKKPGTFLSSEASELDLTDTRSTHKNPDAFERLTLSVFCDVRDTACVL